MRAPLVEFLTPRRPVTFAVFGVFAVWNVIVTYLVAVYVPRDFFLPIREATFGLVGGTLVLAVPLFVVLWLVLMRWGGWRLADFGVNRRDVTVGLTWTAAAWILMQGIQAFVAVSRGDPVRLHGGWSDPGTGILIGTALGQLLGNALYEEMVYRRFFLSQLTHWFGRIRPALVRVLVAVVVSQTFFWAMHFPVALERGVPVHLLAEKTDIILVSGFVFTWIYVQTRNLFLAYGYHAVGNYPQPLFEEAWNARWLVQRVGYTLLLLHLAWLLLTWWRRRRAARENDAN